MRRLRTTATRANPRKTVEEIEPTMAKENSVRQRTWIMVNVYIAANAPEFVMNELPE
jgi:hypothetical protein